MSSSTTRSRRRARVSSSSTSSSRARFAAKNACRVSQSPSTSAWRRNSSRASSGSIRPRSTLRPTTIGTPCSVTRSTATAPARLRDQCGSRVRALDQVPGQRLDPLRLDPRDRARPQPGGLHQLGGHHPARRLLRQRRAREDHEPGAAGAEELARLGLAQADLAEQAGEHGDVDPVGVRAATSLQRHPGVARGRAQLAVQVLPLADAQEVQELVAQQPAEPVAGERGALLLHVAPRA